MRFRRARVAFARAALGAFVALPSTAGCESSLAPYGSVVIELDTDLAVPRLASRTQIDVHRADGTWLATREVSFRDAGELPASFSVFASDDTREHVVLVRVRFVFESAFVDYRGERRLVRDGVDVTPAREPDPALAVDSLVRVTLRPGVERRARVMLLGECGGAPADLEGGFSCGPGGRMTPVAEIAETRAEPRRIGTFGTSPAAAPTPRAMVDSIDRGEVAIPGSAFILGGRAIANDRVTGEIAASSAPPRLVVISPFVIDRTEVTVGRYRRAVASGFVAAVGDPVVNPNPIPKSTGGRFDNRFCTLTAPGDASRDELPLNCITHASARAFCRFAGGDLPTEAEWELAATASSRSQKTTFPWGERAPTCAGAVFSRMDVSSIEHRRCAIEGAPIGPAAIGSGIDDVTPDGVIDLSGNVSEWTRDAYGAFDGPCWKDQPQVDPVCESDDRTALRVVRGGSFAQASDGLVPTLRRPFDPARPYPGFGFRCVRHEVTP